MTIQYEGQQFGLSALLGVFLFALFVGSPFIIWVLAVFRWARSCSRIATKSWRAYVSLAGMAFAGLASLLLIAFVTSRGGEGYESWGFWVCASGVLAGIVGQGRFKWPALTLSFVTALFFIAWPRF